MDCKHELEIGHKLCASRKLAKNAPTGHYEIAWSYYAWRHISHCHGEQSHIIDKDIKADAFDAFRWHWDQLVRLLSEPWNSHEGEDLVPTHSYDSHSKTDPVTMRKDIASHLQKIYMTVEGMVKNAYAKGQEDGENLIGRMASGKLSIEELNQANIDAVKEKEQE